jgi:hypothetical protein
LGVLIFFIVFGVVVFIIINIEANKEKHNYEILKGDNYSLRKQLAEKSNKLSDMETEKAGILNQEKNAINLFEEIKQREDQLKQKEEKFNEEIKLHNEQFSEKVKLYEEQHKEKERLHELQFQKKIKKEEERLKMEEDQLKEKKNNIYQKIISDMDGLIKDRIASYKWLAGMMADFMTIEEHNYYLEYAFNYSNMQKQKRAIRIDELKNEKKMLIEENKILKYELAYIIVINNCWDNMGIMAYTSTL